MAGRTPKKNGRPRKEIDFELAGKMFEIFCTGEDVAYCLNVSYDTLERRVKEKYKISLAEFIKKAQSVGRISLRQKQFQVALSGDRAMLIWLGKQHLGQKDQPDSTADKGLTFKVEFEDDDD